MVEADVVALAMLRRTGEAMPDGLVPLLVGNRELYEDVAPYFAAFHPKFRREELGGMAHLYPPEWIGHENVKAFADLYGVKLLEGLDAKEVARSSQFTDLLNATAQQPLDTMSEDEKAALAAALEANLRRLRPAGGPQIPPAP